GPDPAPQRRGASRGPDPDEQPGLRGHFHAVAGDPPTEPGHLGRAEGRDRSVQGRRIRPDRRRDRRHRTVGYRDRGSRRPVAVRHDQRIRRRNAAREDRQGRFRVQGAAQQERGPRGRQTPWARPGGGMRERVQQQVEAARRAFGLYESLKALADAPLPGPLDRYSEAALSEESADATRRELRRAYNQSLDEIGIEGVGEIKAWP